MVTAIGAGLGASPLTLNPLPLLRKGAPIAGLAWAGGPNGLPSFAQLLQTTMTAPSISTLLGEARRGEPHTSHAAFILGLCSRAGLKSFADDLVQQTIWNSVPEPPILVR